VRFFLFDDWQADIGAAAPLSYRAPDNSSRSGAAVVLAVEARSSSVRRGPQTRCL